MNNEIKYDYLIVGAGIFGSVFAQQAIEAGKTCLIIDKRLHTGGNAYTKNIEGINVHMYGPHIFHTSDNRIWEYVNRFAEFNNYINRPKVRYNDELYSFPINLFTLYQIFGVKTPEEAKSKLDSVKIHNESPRNLEEWILSQVGEEIYNKFIYGYTKKQWGVEPKDLPSSIIKRLPIRLTFDDNYFNDKYQGIPIGGYTKMIENMQEGSDLRLGSDFFENREYYEGIANKIVFTGAIDEFFDYSEGYLEYRSLRFETEILDTDDYQGNAIINYTDENVEFTRICEHKHFESTKSKCTIITKEFPEAWKPGSDRYYPVNNELNNNRYNKYKKMADLKNDKYIFGGRLAEYKYYDMHQVIGSALKKAKELI